MQRIIPFAIFSTRRQDEILRIRWTDYGGTKVLVRDMKNPGVKIGNDIWCDLTAEASAYIESMPRMDDRIFPFGNDAVSTAFTRACQFLAIDDLHFHDLRHDGVSRLFEIGWQIPQVAKVSGHRSWSSLQRYTHINQSGDKYAGWKWRAAELSIPAAARHRDESNSLIDQTSERIKHQGGRSRNCPADRTPKAPFFRLVTPACLMLRKIIVGNVTGFVFRFSDRCRRCKQSQNVAWFGMAATLPPQIDGSTSVIAHDFVRQRLLACTTACCDSRQDFQLPTCHRASARWPFSNGKLRPEQSRGQTAASNWKKENENTLGIRLARQGVCEVL
jgi:hypothetical protein